MESGGGDDDFCLDLLQEALDNKKTDPMPLTHSVLANITNSFCPDQLIGQGGFGSVYRGYLKNGTVVAVKQLHNTINTISILETNFQKEIACLKSVKHKNIVRCLGYCAETQTTLVPQNDGRLVQAEVWHRLFCLEYVSNGDLSTYIRGFITGPSSSGHEWSVRYQIIMGICKGVRYLHGQDIVHMDLKPENILLGDGMVPKITDFGISKRFNQDQTRTITQNKVGSWPYMAPEFLERGIITFMTDIYSLGVIIMEILTGHRGEWCSVDMVLENLWISIEEWRNCHPLLAEQVILCAAIGMNCMDRDSSNRPNIQFIINCLNKMDILNSCSTSRVPSTSHRQVFKELQLEMFCLYYEQAGQACKSVQVCGSKLSPLELSESKSLDVNPLELPFPFQHERNRAQCSVKFTNNRTDRYVGYWIFPQFPMHIRLPDSMPMILDPLCTATVCVEMEIQEQPPTPHRDMLLVVMIRKRNKTDLQGLVSSHEETTTTSSLLRHVEELGGQVHVAMLKAVAVYPPGDGDGVNCQLSSSSLRIMDSKAVREFDDGDFNNDEKDKFYDEGCKDEFEDKDEGDKDEDDKDEFEDEDDDFDEDNPKMTMHPGLGMMMMPPSMTGGASFPGGTGQDSGQLGGTPMSHHHPQHQHICRGGNGIQMQPSRGGAVHGVPAGGAIGAAVSYQGGGGMPSEPPEMKQQYMVMMQWQQQQQQAARNPMAMAQQPQQHMAMMQQQQQQATTNPIAMAQQEQYMAKTQQQQQAARNPMAMPQQQQQHMAMMQQQQQQAATNPIAMAQQQQAARNAIAIPQQQYMPTWYPAMGHGYGRPSMQYPPPAPYSYYNPFYSIFSDENPNSCTVM